ncbi:phage tail sheath C-terminal domain-containing protein [Caulobacter sp. RL271]|uniref:Tail sheath protein C-terminal domain-containing protein n=1 Tax=Caulobacter segnis TaxID=88688 RepID=A0ABY4ZY17_9CAUL|nr:phage tail sheath C-terminal domain-containing protein [Caulobacter segnis]USQ97239.1 hypothetical protein MZV50_06770 [Caulobacter segnis]
MTEPTFGITLTPVDNETRTPSAADMSIVGIIGTAADADAGTFPVNTPVLMTSDDAGMLADLGAAGELKNAIAELDANTGGRAAKIVVVRVTAGANTAATMVNIIGDASTKTGLHAFKEAAQVLGVTPRLILVPNFTGVVQKGVSLAITTPGNSGANGTFNFVFSGGAGTGAAGTFTVTGGSIASLAVTNPGIYTAAPTAAVTASAGLTGAAVAVTLVDLANSVCVALGPVLDDLKAVAFVSGPDSTSTAAKAWRALLTHQRLMPVDNGLKVQVGESLVTIDPASAFNGLQVLCDAEAGGVPSKVIANRPVQGSVGLTRAIRFSLTDGSVDGQDLLAHQIGITVRGSTADGAIADSGFVAVVLDNAGEDELWRQYHQVRMRDYIDLLLVRTTRSYIGRFGLKVQTIQAVLNTMNTILRDLQVGGHVLGGKVDYDAAGNTPEALRAGKFTVNFRAEPVPTLRNLAINTYRYSAALDDLLTQIAA